MPVNSLLYPAACEAWVAIPSASDPFLHVSMLEQVLPEFICAHLNAATLLRLFKPPSEIDPGNSIIPEQGNGCWMNIRLLAGVVVPEKTDQSKMADVYNSFCNSVVKTSKRSERILYMANI